MKVAPENLLIFLNRLSQDPQYALITGWLQDLYKEQAIVALKASTEVAIRRAQGAGETLEYILDHFKNPGEVLRRLRENQKAKEFNHDKA